MEISYFFSDSFIDCNYFTHHRILCFEPQIVRQIIVFGLMDTQTRTEPRGDSVINEFLTSKFTSGLEKKV